MVLVTPEQAVAQPSVEGLYRRYARDVFSVAYRLVGSRAEAEDVTQTTFLNAHRALLDGVEPTDQRAWLLTIARNACRSRYRTLRRRPREEPLDESLFTPLPEEDESASRVTDALRALLPRQRAALVMQAVDGCSTAEIGEKLGLGATAVDALLFRARAAIRDELRADVELVGCGRIEALVERQLRHDLEGDEQAGLRAHLRGCSSCATAARRLRARKRLGSLLGVPWDLANRLAGLFGQGGAAVKVVATLGALTIGTTVAVESGPRRHGVSDTPAQPSVAVGPSPTNASVPGRLHRSSIAFRGAHARATPTALPVAPASRGRQGRPAQPATTLPDAGVTDTRIDRHPTGTGTTTSSPAQSTPIAVGGGGPLHTLSTVTGGATGSVEAGAGNAGLSAGVSLGAGGAGADVGVNTGLVDAGVQLSAGVSPAAGVGVSTDVDAAAGTLGGVDVSAAASSSGGVSASVGVAVPGGQATTVTVGVPPPVSAPLPLPTLPTLPALPPVLGG